MSVPRLPGDAEIAGCFNARFGRAWHVRLVGGGAEPLYLPAAAARPALIRYTRDYARSALHELAHWCIAGAERRTRVDYGYWYVPPPRDAETGRAFARAEARAQALERVFAEAVGLPFQVSADDPQNLLAGEAALEAQVALAYERWHARGLPPRPSALCAALAARFAVAA